MKKSSKTGNNNIRFVVKYNDYFYIQNTYIF